MCMTLATICRCQGSVFLLICLGIGKSDHRVVYDNEDKALGLKRKSVQKSVFHEKLFSKPCEEYGLSAKVLKLFQKTPKMHSK
jgi:hypothetical protein